MLSVFFISNFTPEKNFFQYFNDLLEKYYNQYTINIEIDHKYTLTKYLSEFNTRPKINSYEIANGKFTTELIIENGKSSLKYSCESESIKQSKKLVWCKAYEKLVVSVQHFFFTANENESEVKETVSFFVNKVCNNHISKLLFYKNYSLLIFLLFALHRLELDIIYILNLLLLHIYVIYILNISIFEGRDLSLFCNIIDALLFHIERIHINNYIVLNLLHYKYCNSLYRNYLLFHKIKSLQKRNTERKK